MEVDWCERRNGFMCLDGGKFDLNGKRALGGKFVFFVNVV